jgi:hypothetical protein
MGAGVAQVPTVTGIIVAGSGAEVVLRTTDAGVTQGYTGTGLVDM